VPSLTLVLGPARSGKSRWAEHLATLSGKGVVYVATGWAADGDPAWEQRLAQHRQRRPPGWGCLEVAADLAPALAPLQADQVALIDSLGSWVAHGLSLADDDWADACQALLQAIQGCRADLVFVSEQTGWGVVPPTAIGGLFRDRLGVVEQRLVALAHTSWLVVAGRAVNLTALGHPVPSQS
jgi:adenosylcobinamide kinase / adenosylcobinamide-phosphate guanylyltransferase